MPDPTRNGPPPQPADTASAEPVTFGPGADAKGNPALMGSTRYNEPMVKQTPRPEPDPERERTKAILYAATFVLAAARRGDDIDEALAEMMVDRQWEKCGGPPQELDILRRAHELDPTNGPISRAIHALELDAEWDTPLPSDGTGDQPKPDPPDPKPPAEPPLSLDALRAEAQEIVTWCVKAMMAADQVEAFRGRSAAIRAIIDR